MSRLQTCSKCKETKLFRFLLVLKLNSPLSKDYNFSYTYLHFLPLVQSVQFINSSCIYFDFHVVSHRNAYRDRLFSVSPTSFSPLGKFCPIDRLALFRSSPDPFVSSSGQKARNINAEYMPHTPWPITTFSVTERAKTVQPRRSESCCESLYPDVIYIPAACTLLFRGLESTVSRSGIFVTF